MTQCDYCGDKFPDTTVALTTTGKRICGGGECIYKFILEKITTNKRSPYLVHKDSE